ncbi:MAG: hypothetical protein KC476_00075 [Cyanobacteria bacterium HKST-UBA06]|nr:hypothetical protein [Cyanobacteria bacterium HKST-UBA05]MCA9799043.1 hypothetical protein [Cyanobacteria bacterium HKST-UBA04]MCA9806324.1 hypothetical protein [Cyanobacteria bacterium HKST-UBA06]MCA9840673.1 hypothetical protein [Cyanobacteria bacterium HKST-UBA03]
MKTILKTGGAVVLTLAGFSLLPLLFLNEQKTATVAGYEAYFHWAYLAGALMVLAGFAYVLALGHDEVATLDEAHQASDKS